jgi:ubiquitin carboxyl-terminal hydrolase 36/42
MMTLSLTFESSVEKGLSNFLKEETLDISENYRCDKCKEIAKVKIRTELSKLPEILTLHLKRFTYHPNMKKIKGHSSYEPYLDMSK